jgi:uridine phosphorylase
MIDQSPVRRHSLDHFPYPILEFDPERQAMIEPSRLIQPQDVPPCCVICFFQDVIAQVVASRNARIVAESISEIGRHPLYEIQHEDRRLAFFHPGIGGPLAAGLLEEMIAAGCRKFIVCGGAGVLEPNIAVGHLVVVSAAVRDEGVSYHYLPPAREIQADPHGVAALEAALTQAQVPYRVSKTWTTDAIFRETAAKVAARRAEGCCVVEMEAASLMAVARFRGVTLGQILYGGDDLSGDEWDHRNWNSRSDIRLSLFWLAADACLSLPD